MICKKDVILWFKELESYKRIDMMCTLLNMCLPFELRFLGTCLEELGRRDSQELRGIELRVNNPQDLANDMMACQKGEPTDKKIRRKMALYLALIRACNRSCVAEIFRTLDGWGERDFHKMNDSDTLQELLLVYTMAANHPVFSFEQHMKCTEIFEKIKENKLVCAQQQQQQYLSQQQVQTMTDQHLQAVLQHQQDLRHHITPPSPQQDIMSQHHALHAMHITGQHHQMQSAPITVMPQGSIPVNFPHTHLAKIIPSDANVQHQIAMDGIPHMISSNVAIPADLAMSHPATWALRSNLQFVPHAPSSIEQPPQSSSPMLSQQSSPSSSRTTSPNRSSTSVIMQQSVQQHQHASNPQIRNMPQRVGVSLKNIRRPSTESTPPPLGQTHQQLISNDVILPQNVKQMDDVAANADSSMTQLQTLIRNGFGRSASHHRHKAGNFLPHHQQQIPINQHFHAVSTGNFTGLSYSMQNMSLLDGIGGSHSNEGNIIAQPRNKSGGSDSGSSIGSSGEISPPETPNPMANMPSNHGPIRGNEQVQQLQQKSHLTNYNKQMNIPRINGRADKIISAASGGSGNSLVYAPSPNTQQQNSQQQFMGTDLILAPSSVSNSGCLMPVSLATNPGNNNANSNSGTITVPAVNAVSASMGNTVIISSPSTAVGCGLSGNIITSNAVMQPQYNSTYPYHAAQHISSGARPPIISQHPGLGPPPPGSFRLPSFQIPPNGEMIYPAYHTAGIAFLSAGAPLGPTAVALRSSTSTSVNQQQQPASSTSQSNPSNVLQQQLPSTPISTLLTASPYTSPASIKPMSCYNCGSQAHNGRDCHEASMDDVTRSAIYKLDYSVSSANASPTGGNQLQLNSSPISVCSNSIASGSGSDCQQHIQQSQQKQHIMAPLDLGMTSSTTSTSSSLAP